MSEPAPRRARILGVDLGDARVGLALSDSSHVLASPYAILDARDEQSLFAEIGRVIDEHGVGLVVIGLPKSMNGAIGPRAEATLAIVERLRARLGVPIELVDERLSTVEAQRHGAAVGRAPRRIDDRAAAIILQSFLDAQVMRDGA